MAINKTINKRTNSHGAMRNCIEYILREGKTEQHLVHIIGPYPYEKVNYTICFVTMQRIVMWQIVPWLC